MEKVLIFQLKMKNIIILDNAITHKPSKVNDKIKKCKTTLAVIPSGLI